MPLLNPLDQLRADFAALTRRSPNSMSIDQRRSVAFYLAECAVLAGIEVPPLTPARTVQWLRALADLEVFLARERRWPRDNNRLKRNTISKKNDNLPCGSAPNAPQQIRGDGANTNCGDSNAFPASSSILSMSAGTRTSWLFKSSSPIIAVLQ